MNIVSPMPDSRVAMAGLGQEASGDGEWRNLWRELFVEEWGEEEAEKRIRERSQFPSGGKLGLMLYTNMILVGFRFGRHKHEGKFIRPSHPLGVGARGTATLAEGLDEYLPVNEFFTPGRTINVRVRHANSRFHDDDAMLDGRGFSIKFDDVTEGGSLDLVMNTGEKTFFQNLPTFIDIVKTKQSKDPLFIRKCFYKTPTALEGVIDFMRRAPSSFTHLSYYAQLTYLLKDKDGRQHHVRFRCVPDDVRGHPDSGRPGRADQKNPQNFERLPEETRPKNYLRDGFLGRLSERELLYHIEIQVHDQVYSEQSDREIFNPSTAWDSSKYPWRPLADVALTTALDDHETDQTRYTIANRPACLTFPAATSQWDYNSIAHGREKAYSWVHYWRKKNN